MLIHAREAECRWNQRSRRLAVRTKCLAVHEQLRVELPRPPARQDLAHRRLIHLQQRGHRTEVRSERDDRADVQIAVCPPVEPMPDAGRERVVHRRVTERTLHAHRRDASVGSAHRRDADDRLRVEERKRVRRIVEVHPARCQATENCRRHAVDVDFQPHRERSGRAHSRSDPSEPGSGDRLVQLERAAPELFIAEGVVAKNILAATKQRFRVVADRPVERTTSMAVIRRALAIVPRSADVGRDDGCRHHGEKRHNEDRSRESCFHGGLRDRALPRGYRLDGTRLPDACLGETRERERGDRHLHVADGDVEEPSGGHKIHGNRD